MKGTHRKALHSVWLIAAMVVMGCGSGGGGTTASTRLSPRTVTKTTTLVVVPAKRLSTSLPPLPGPMDCGRGITSNGACFPDLVAAFKHLWNESGVPPGKLTADGTSATCTGYARDAWLCKTNNQGDPLVYTAFTYAAPGQPAAASVKVTTGPSAPSAPLPSSASPPAPNPTKSFSGNGGENIGTINIPADSTIRWTDDGGLFQVLDFGINSQGTSGTSVLAAGTYRNVEVNALGNWTLKIVPGS